MKHIQYLCVALLSITTVMHGAVEKAGVEEFSLANIKKQVSANPSKIDAKDKNGDTLLIRAVRRADLDVINYLLDANANPNITNNYGNNALIVAANHRRPRVAKALIAKGVTLNVQNRDGNTAVIVAIQSVQPEQEKNEKRSVKARYEVVEVVLKAGANPNLKNKNGKTALQIAQSRNLNGIVTLLKKSGAQ